MTTETTTTALPDTPFRMLPDKRTTVFPDTTTIMLPDTTTTALTDTTANMLTDITTTTFPDTPTNMLPDITTTVLPGAPTSMLHDITTTVLPDTTTSILPDTTSRMLLNTESSSQEPITSTSSLQQETTIINTTPVEFICFDADPFCRFLDDHLRLCSEQESASKLCAKTCGYCGATIATTTTTPELMMTPVEPIGATSGTCPQGFVQCTNGACESYASLCGQFAPNPPPTTASIVSSSTTVTSPTEWTSSSMPTDEKTVMPPFTSTTYSGPETCPVGFEKCPDGKCEAFHFLCDEHSPGNPAIAVIG